VGLIGRWLAHPLTRGIGVDDPRTTELRTRIVREKAFLRRLYEDWYATLAAAVPEGAGQVLEVGSGAGFLKQVVPQAITSEVFHVPHVDLVLDAMALPFGGGGLKAVVLVDVLHHMRDPARFFEEAARCVRPGGACLMIEPWNTSWSRFVYQRFHHEPFEPDAGWTLPPGGPLSTANGALPWILFERDRADFARRFPQWRIEAVRPRMPVAYLASGGVSMRSLLPGALYAPLRLLERAIPGVERGLGMFAFIVLRRVAQ
jgi:SAM-dependent methyltransferase